MMELEVTTEGPGETMRLGARMGSLITGRMVIALTGELGSGKTVLARGICGGLGVRGPVTSPSFIIVNEYEGRLPVYHVDLYRIDSPGELESTGFDEYAGGEGVTIVEWAEKAEGRIPSPALDVRIASTGREERAFRISARGDDAVSLLEALEERME